MDSSIFWTVISRRASSAIGRTRRAWDNYVTVPPFCTKDISHMFPAASIITGPTNWPRVRGCSHMTPPSPISSVLVTYDNRSHGRLGHDYSLNHGFLALILDPPVPTIRLHPPTPPLPPTPIVANPLMPLRKLICATLNPSLKWIQIYDAFFRLFASKI